MPNPHYRSGDRFEKRVIDDLGDNGYRAWQSRNSRGLADVIALKPGQVLLVQVKAGFLGMTHEEWNGLYKLATAVGAVPLIADRERTPPYYPIRYRRLVGAHISRKQDWPAVAWAPDEVERAAALARHPAGKHRP